MQYYGYEKEAGFRKYIELALQNGISLEGLIKGSNEEFPVVRVCFRLVRECACKLMKQCMGERFPVVRKRAFAIRYLLICVHGRAASRGRGCARHLLEFVPG